MTRQAFLFMVWCVMMMSVCSECLKIKAAYKQWENLEEQYERHCENADAKLFQKMEQQVLNEDAQLMQVLQNPDSDLPAFCQAKVPVIESILQRYKWPPTKTTNHWRFLEAGRLEVTLANLVQAI